MTWKFILALSYASAQPTAASAATPPSTVAGFAYAQLSKARVAPIFPATIARE
ncbi:hypothetical protein [Sphingorhabdus sp.]|jgi:hypothetical protein|uniref:hypothetical protein n=1 Tax=Sphingorhabdus sp. TaxID=1902408 RepID=UPI0037C8CF27